MPMSSVSQTRWSETRLNAESRARGDRRGWRFWLPIALIAFAMFASIHQASYALDAGGDKIAELDEAAAVESRSISKQAGFLMLGMLGLGLCVAPTCGHGSIHRPLVAVLALLFMYAVASCVWSDSPSTTLRRTAVLGMILVGAFGAARHWNSLDLCRAVTILSTMFICVGVVFELRSGTFLNGHDYRFSGTLHPNRQALNCSLLTLASLALFVSDRRRAWAVLFCVGFGFLLLTRSRGGTASCLAAVGMFWWLGASRVKRLGVCLGAGAVLSVVLMYLALASDSGPDWKAIGSMGRTAQTADPTTLTGRFPIWQQVYSDARTQPWLGHGYGAFWTSGRVHGYSFIHDNWAFSNAHSIYLETMVNLGLVGVALGLLVILVAVRRILALLKQRRDPELQFVVAVIALCSVNGLVEAICVSPGYVFIVISLGMAVVAHYETPRAEGDA